MRKLTFLAAIVALIFVHSTAVAQEDIYTPRIIPTPLQCNLSATDYVPFAKVTIATEAVEAINGEADNVVANAPHIAEELAGEWSHPYSRYEAAFPLAWVARSKFFPYVTKIDNGYGDRNLVCKNE